MFFLFRLPHTLHSRLIWILGWFKAFLLLCCSTRLKCVNWLC